MERAFFRRGDRRLADALSSLEDISNTWSERKQKSLVKKILEASCSLSALVTEAAALMVVASRVLPRHLLLYPLLLARVRKRNCRTMCS